MGKRNFPRQGQDTVLVVPLNPEFGEDVLNDDIVKSMGILLESSQDFSKTSITVVRERYELSAWHSNLVLPRCAAVRQQIHQRIFRSIRMFKESTVFPQIVHDKIYVILSLRKCSRGGPLLPVTSPGDSHRLSGWEAPSTTGSDGAALKMPLADYLREFIARIGAPTIGIYDNVDGWTLAPYQAAVTRDEWERAWPVLEPLFREQRAAYRRLNGGSCAPDIAVSTTPKLHRPVNFAAKCATVYIHNGDINLEPDDEPLPTRGTFVHFGKMSPVRPRSDSLPNLEPFSDSEPDAKSDRSPGSSVSTRDADDDSVHLNV